MSVLDWLDQYVDVDRLHLRPAQLLPQMRWWEWVWYFAVLTASALAAPAFDGWQNRIIQPVPYLNHVAFVVTWPVFGVVYGLGAHFLLPAREARAAAPGEAWLAGAVWLAVGALGLFVDLDWSA